MKNKGFTLIEIIAVITILGVILLFAIPQIGKMTIGNDIEKYEKFMDVLNKSLHTYADMELGPTGMCTIRISDLKDKEYLNEVPNGVEEDTVFNIKKVNNVVSIFLDEDIINFDDGKIECIFSTGICNKK